MKIKKIKYLNLVNDSLDVFVTLENDASYLVKVGTPKFLSTLMEKVESDFVPAGYPYIIVSTLTDEIIRAAIQEFMDAKEDSYWLKLYSMTATLKIEDRNEILDRKEEEDIELEAKIKISLTSFRSLKKVMLSTFIIVTCIKSLLIHNFVLNYQSLFLSKQVNSK